MKRDMCCPPVALMMYTKGKWFYALYKVSTLKIFDVLDMKSF